MVERTAAHNTKLTKEKHYLNVRFSADTLREAIQVFRTQTNTNDESDVEFLMSVNIDDSVWAYDSEEEFFADYRRSSGTAAYQEYRHDNKAAFAIQSFITHPSTTGPSTLYTIVKISAPDRGRIEAVFAIFERDVDASRLPPPEKPHPVVFIGHGRDLQWRDMKDHLHEKHGYRVEAYEIGARTGHAVRDVLGDMLSKTSFAILVLTGEDETPDGGFRARQNVIHEAGLFQGRLGFDRAIILLEEGTEEFSNIQGIEQIRFGKKNIKETFGEVLATLRREFEA